MTLGRGVTGCNWPKPTEGCQALLTRRVSSFTQPINRVAMPLLMLSLTALPLGITYVSINSRLSEQSLVFPSVITQPKPEEIIPQKRYFVTI